MKYRIRILSIIIVIYNILSAEMATAHRDVVKCEAQKPFRQNEKTHYTTISDGIVKIVHRSENVQFHNQCLRLLRTKSTANRKEIQAAVTELARASHLKKPR